MNDIIQQVIETARIGAQTALQSERIIKTSALRGLSGILQATFIRGEQTTEKVIPNQNAVEDESVVPQFIIGKSWVIGQVVQRGFRRSLLDPSQILDEFEIVTGVGDGITIVGETTEEKGGNVLLNNIPLILGVGGVALAAVSNFTDWSLKEFLGLDTPEDDWDDISVSGERGIIDPNTGESIQGLTTLADRISIQKLENVQDVAPFENAILLGNDGCGFDIIHINDALESVGMEARVEIQEDDVQVGTAGGCILNFEGMASVTDDGSGKFTIVSGTGDTQDLFETFTADTGSTTANSPTDTFNFVGGANITTAISGDTVTITGAAGGGETNTGSNVGGGAEVFKQKVGVDFRHRTLVASTNITIQEQSTFIQIAAASGTGGGGGGGNLAGVCQRLEVPTDANGTYELEKDGVLQTRYVASGNTRSKIASELANPANVVAPVSELFGDNYSISAPGGNNLSSFNVLYISNGPDSCLPCTSSTFRILRNSVEINVGTSAICSIIDANCRIGTVVAVSLAINNGGTGYIVGEEVSVGGLAGNLTPPDLIVSSVSGTVVTGLTELHNIQTINPVPSNPIQATTVGGDVGAAFVFIDGTPWTEEDILLPTDLQDDASFGQSVTLSSDGNVMAVGATKDAFLIDGGLHTVTIFTRSGGTWSIQQTISNPATGRFGQSLSLSNDGTILSVGATETVTKGSVYIFTESGGTWSQQQKIEASDGSTNDFFGYSVALNAAGNKLVVGRDPVPDLLAGSVYIFSESGGTWSQDQKITSSVFGFGHDVDIAGDNSKIIIGSPGDNTGRGAVHIFKFTSSWVLEQKIIPSGLSVIDQAGISVAIDGDGNTIAFGIIGIDITVNDQGRVDVYTESGGTWTLEQSLTASDAAEDDIFGSSIDLAADGDTLLIGAKGQLFLDPNGSAYLFTRVASTWTEDEIFSDPSGGNAPRFGHAVAISDDGLTGSVTSILKPFGSSGSGLTLNLDWGVGSVVIDFPGRYYESTDFVFTGGTSGTVASNHPASVNSITGKLQNTAINVNRGDGYTNPTIIAVSLTNTVPKFP